MAPIRRDLVSWEVTAMTIPQCRVPAKWVAGLVGIILMGWFLDWNEHRSPWGAANQVAKIEYLKKKICN